MSNHLQSKYSHKIKAEAKRLGFLSCGISKARFLDEEAARLDSWLKNNMNGQMKYMENNFAKRLDPGLLFDGAKSVISLLFNYYTDEKQKHSDAPKISKYAYGKDYHIVIKDKLNQLIKFIHNNIGQVNGRAFVDSAPVMERSWARLSGLGWIGKNTMLITKNSGSFVFLGELILDIELNYDTPIENYCGTCSRCIDACPTNAIVEPYIVDGNKCISYFTIELKDEITSEMKQKLNNRIFGCDICQDVCPWNNKAIPHTEPAFNPHPDLLKMTKNDWNEITEEAFEKIFKNSAVKRIKFNQFKRNLEFLKDY